MNIKTILQKATLSTAALGLIFMPRTATAVDLNFYHWFGPSDCSDFCTTEELWQVHAQIGGNTKELSIGSPETAFMNADWKWSDGTIYDWNLKWNSGDEIATFIISDDNDQNQTLIYDLAGIFPEDGIVNGMQLTTFVRQEDKKLAAGTSINLTLNSVNGESLLAPVNATATNTENAAGEQNLFIASDAFINGFELGGTVSFDWPTFNPQAANANSRAFFQFEANHVDFDLELLDLFKTEEEETVSTSKYTAYTEVPEPTSIFGLLTLGSGGLLTKLTSSKRNLKSKED